MIDQKIIKLIIVYAIGTLFTISAIPERKKYLKKKKESNFTYNDKMRLSYLNRLLYGGVGALVLAIYHTIKLLFF
jgi:hypothetical protein